MMIESHETALWLCLVYSYRIYLQMNNKIYLSICCLRYCRFSVFNDRFKLVIQFLFSSLSNCRLKIFIRKMLLLQKSRYSPGENDRSKAIIKNKNKLKIENEFSKSIRLKLR